MEQENKDTPRDTIFGEEESGEASFAEINFDFLDAGRWLLKVIGGPNNGAEFSLQASSSYIIGTDPNSCDVVFHDTSVSRQHARVSVTSDDRLFIEDMKSRNGVLVDGETIKGKVALNPNSIVNLGTSSFVVYDREGEMQTIISPLMPSIVKVLQKEESKASEEALKAAEDLAAKNAAALELEKAKKSSQAHPIGGLILIGIITGIFVIAGIGISTLFKSQPVQLTEEVDTTAAIADVMKTYPSVKYTFNKPSGKILLVGHVLNASDKSQMLYGLNSLGFLKEIDDSGVVIDEYVWQETNQVVNKNPTWRGINIYSPTPGKFILTGYLQTRKQAEQLSDYITSNFPYLDLLEKRVFVEEDVSSSISNLLQTMGFRDIVVQLTNGAVSLTGNIARGKGPDLESAVEEIKKIPGIRSVQNFTAEVAPELNMINISDKYEVTGFSTQAGNVSVVINGRILTKGDLLDGMIISSIKGNTIMLEKDGVQYRIDFSR